MATRREFLSGEPIREALQRAAEAADPAACEPLAANTLRLGKVAMASDFEVILNPGDKSGLAAASAALDLIDRLEDQMSIYRPHSELSRLNARAAVQPVTVEPQLYALLKQAVGYSREFDGAFDPSAGPLVALWRQCRRERRLPADDELRQARERLGISAIQFDDETHSIGFTRAGIELNLNALGKGYALDRAAEVISQSNAEAADTRPLANWLIHGGHSSLLARGSLVGQAGWPVAIRHPRFPTRRLATIRLNNRGMSTSGAEVQHFRVAGKRYGHLLDPRTGWPAEALLSATVLAPTAAQAEALSTAFFVMGVEKALEYCHNHSEIAALLVPTSRNGKRLEPVVIGMNDGDLTWEPDL